jgi:hypothetical protein
VIWYLMNHLAGKTQEYLSRFRMPDEAVREFREAFFRGPKEERDDVVETKEVRKAREMELKAFWQRGRSSTDAGRLRKERNQCSVVASQLQVSLDHPPAHFALNDGVLFIRFPFHSLSQQPFLFIPPECWEEVLGFIGRKEEFPLAIVCLD